MRTFIVGNGGHARVIESQLQISGHKEIFFIIGNEEICNKENLIKEKDFFSLDNILENETYIGLGFKAGSSLRQKVFDRFKKHNITFSSTVHPHSFFDKSSFIGEGSQVLAGTVIMNDTFIGLNSLINTSTSINHDCKIGNNVNVSPGTTICGNVVIKDNVYIGPGSIIGQGVTIGEDSIIGAGSVILKNVKSGAKIIQK